MSLVLGTYGEIDIVVAFAEARPRISHFQHSLDFHIQSREVLCDTEIVLCFIQTGLGGDLFIDQRVDFRRRFRRKQFQFLKGRVKIADIRQRKAALCPVQRDPEIRQRFRVAVIGLQVRKSPEILVKVRDLVGMEYTGFAEYRDHLVDKRGQSDDIHRLHG